MKRASPACIAPILFLFLLAATARAGSVSGRVLDSAGRPIAGAKVQWVAYRDEDRVLLDQTRGADPTPLGETTTDAEGKFRVALEKPNLSVAVRILPSGLPSARFAGPFEATEDTSLFDIQIPPAGKASGRVLDENGKPVAGARVVAIGSEAFFEGEARFSAETRTQPDGSFSIADAPEGARVLSVRAPGFVPLTRVQIEARSEERLTVKRGGTIRGSVLDAASKPASGVLVTTEDVAAETDASGRYEISGVSPGVRQLQAIWKEDFAARRENVRVKKGEEIEAALKLARAAAIAGTVIEEGAQRPVEGVRVSASSVGGFGFGRSRHDRTARTDAHGRYRLGGLASRRYVVEAGRDGYLSSSISNVVASVKAPGSANLALRRAASVAGRVVDEKGQAVAGARVRVTQEMGMRAMMQRGAAAAASLLGQGVLTGPDGAFRLRNLAPARNLALEAARSGYATAHQPGINLKPGDAVKDLSLVLRKGLEVRGRVVDAQGQPVQGAEVRAILREAGAGGMRAQIRLRGMDREKPDAVSGTDGGFLIKGLEEGEYTAAVSRDGFARKSVPSLSVKGSGENVWPPIALTPGIAITGFVRDSAGQPISGAQILALDPGGASRPIDASTGPDGRFRLDGLAGERPLMLNVSAEGYAGLQKNVTPPAEEMAIVLKSAGTIRGRVEDADAKRPVTDFSIGRSAGRGGGFFVNVQMGGRGGERAFQSEDGAFEVTDVPPGKWTVRASATGYRPAEIAGVEVGEGETREGVVLSLKHGGSFAGRVLDPRRGTGVPNASVTWETPGSGGGPMAGAFARMAGGASNTATNTDADGRFSFDGVPDGKVMLTASHPDYLDVTREVDPSKEPSVDLVLGIGGSISGTVVGENGRTPVPGARVSLNEEGDTAFGFGGDSTRADGSGNFLFEHLRPGRFKVIAQGNTGKTVVREVVLADGQRLDGVLLQMATGTLVVGTVSGLPSGRLAGVRINANGKDYSDNTQADDTGKFTLRDVPAGAVHFNASTSFLSGRSTSKTVEIPEGAAQFPVEIVFEGASRLSGRVTRGDRPLGSLFVNANPTGPGAGTSGRATGQTDENGQYTLEGLNDGEYVVMLFGQGVSYRKTFMVSGDTGGDIPLPPVQLRGSVTEAGSGEPLEGVAIQAQVQAQPGQSGAGGFSMKAGVTDSTGRYFIDDVDSSAYQVTARKNGYQGKTQNLTVGGDSADLDFGLQRGEGISIRVVDGLTGLPLKGVNVAALAGGGAAAFQGSVSLDSTGKGEITSLGPGLYTIHFFSDGYAPRTVVVDAPSPLLSLAMTPGGRVEVATAAPLSGRIVDAAGLPYQLSPWRTDGRVGGAPPVVSWDHFAPGSYQLLVGPAGAEKPYPFTVVEGQTTRVEVK